MWVLLTIAPFKNEAVTKSGAEELPHFTVSWMGGAEPAITNPDLFKDPAPSQERPVPSPVPSQSPTPGLAKTDSSPLPSRTSKDYESVTLMKLRQAEERKRVLQQLHAKQEDDGHE